MTQQPLDVVSLDDERAEFEATPALVATLNVKLERTFEKLGPGAISRTMGGRVHTVSVGRGSAWSIDRQRRHDERAYLRCCPEYA